MEKIKVVVLGATGLVGQYIVARLDGHPWFETIGLAASADSVGKTYGEAVAGRWYAPGDIPPRAAGLPVLPCEPIDGAKIAFSALDAAVAGLIEDAFALAGCFVCSNASNHRMNPFVPLVIPEVNPGHLALLNSQGYGRGGIITNPNCSTAGIALALAPLHRRFGVEAAVVTTMQSLSGAGYPGVPALDVAANVIPHIAGEEEKIEAETKKILGEPGTPAAMRISAQCNRVGTMVGHLAAVSVGLRFRATLEDVSETLSSFRPLEGRGLPGAPMSPIILINEPDRPQPVRDAGRGGGMSVTIGKLGPDSVLDYKFTLLVNNLVRGAAGAAILNAEFVALLAAEGRAEYC